MDERDFRNLYRPIRRFFQKRCFSPEDSHDLTQDTLLAAVRGLPRFRHQSTMETWVLSIAANVWRDSQRARWRLKRNRNEVSLDALQEEGRLEAAEMLRLRQEEVVAQEALQGVLLRERQEHLRLALEQLPDLMRQCVLLRIDQELKYEEIVEVLRIPVHRVKSMLHQAKRKLKKELADLGSDLDL